MALRATLVVLAIYLGVAGAMFLLAHDLAIALLQIDVRDPVAFRQWGAALLVLGILSALLAVDPVPHRMLLLVPLLGLPLDSAVLAYELLTGASGLRQLGAPLAINLLIFALLVLFYPRRARPETAPAPGLRVAEDRPL